MKIKGNGCSALILAAGLWVCFAGPSPAAPATAASSTAGTPVALKHTRHSSHHWRRYAHHQSSKVATGDKKTDTTDVAADDTNKSSTPSSSSEITPSVANANAQLAASDAPTGNAAQAMSVQASNILQNAQDNPGDTQPAAEAQVVAPDQLNDVDRALHENNNTPAAPLAVASAEPPVVAASTARSSENTWDQASLIGKIFIGFGALLTMASAARMFMA